MSLLDHAKEDLVELFLHNLPHHWREWLRGATLKKAVLVLLAAVAVLVKFVVLPSVVAHAVEGWAATQRIHLEAEDWEADLHDLTVTARDVVVRTAGSYTKSEIFKAEAVEIDLSLWSRLDRGPWVREVVVKDPSVYLERQLSGYWNWQEVVRGAESERESAPGAPGAAWPPAGVQSAGVGAVEAPERGALSTALAAVATALLWLLRLLAAAAFLATALIALVALVSMWKPAGVLGLRSRRRAAAMAVAATGAAALAGLLMLLVRPSPKSFDLESLRVERMRVEWVENLPGQSGGGLMHSSRATLFVDDLDVGVENLHGRGIAAGGPTRFELEGRLGGGKISAHGEVALAAPVAAVVASPAIVPAVAPAEPPAPAPEPAPEQAPFALRADVYVENLQAGVLAQVAPDAALMPNTGALTGMLRLTRPLAPLELQCRTRQVVLTGFGWAPNPDAANWRPSSQAARYLGSHRQSGPLPDDTDCGCKGPLESCRPFAAIMAALTDAGLDRAPREVRRAAAVDQVRFTGVLAEGDSDETAAKVAALVGEDMSAELLRVAASQAAPGAPGGNALTRLAGKVRSFLHR